MTQSKLKQLDRLIKKLSDAQVIADRLEITVGNGGEVGSLIGTLRDELEVQRSLANLRIVAH